MFGNFTMSQLDDFLIVRLPQRIAQNHSGHIIPRPFSTFQGCYYYK